MNAYCNIEVSHPVTPPVPAGLEEKSRPINKEGNRFRVYNPANRGRSVHVPATDGTINVIVGVGDDNGPVIREELTVPELLEEPNKVLPLGESEEFVVVTTTVVPGKGCLSWRS